MSDYKNTLNLPQTAFPMKANLAVREPEILKQWESLDLYAQLREQGHGKKKFILPDGPPYANGHLHLGHALNKVLKDMVVKSKTFSGYDAPFVPGWDCHGLPIELNVEKKIGKPGRHVTAKEFRLACRDYASSQIDIQRIEFKRLGVIGDWEHPYRTMDFKFESNVIRALSLIISHHHVQKGSKPVHWCLDCGSALAEAEVEYAEKKSPSIDVRFTVVNETDVLSRFKSLETGLGTISIPIWTTTPWTLPANEAVSLNPEIDYVMVECNGNSRLIFAEALLQSVMNRYGIENYRVLGSVSGKLLEGIKLNHPFYDKQVPVILGEHVTTETGTGAVHTAPAHGQDDYQVAKKYHLPIENPVGDDGCFISTTPIFAGMHVTKVNDLIIETLKEHDSLLNLSTITHSYPHCWRHKSPIIFRATPQWFINMDQAQLRSNTMAAIEKVTWIPGWGKTRIAGMIENHPGWCISRQRTWGVPLSLFIHKETGELHKDNAALMEKVALLVEEKGIEAWYDLDPETLLGSRASQYQKSLDVLDVWFDSGVAHYCLPKTHPELSFPADLFLEGSDQHRGWFQSSLLTSMAINNTAPYKTVLTHGFLLDGQGRKMSKSLGNVIAPDEVIKTLGADVLRLWVASTDYRNDVTASQEILTRTSEAYRRIRNTARFLLANLHDFDPDQDLVPSDKMLMLDRWAVDNALRIQEEILEAYETYQFHVISQKLHQFCVTDLGGFYLDIIKDRQYTMPINSLGRRSAQTALFHIIHALVRWMAPVLSFTAEEIWTFIPGKKSKSVFLTTWYDQLTLLPEKIKMNHVYWNTLRAVRDAVNKEIENQRNASKIGSALEAEVYLYCTPELKHTLDLLETELRFFLITAFTEVFEKNGEKGEIAETEVPGLSIKILPTPHAKCERCWHRREDVGSHATHPGLCDRCVENIDGSGEKRKFA